MLYLRTLGVVGLTSPNGMPPGPSAAQRRLLALLSLLSAAGSRGMSRDRVLALLWPDGDPLKSRHALTQSMYHARRSLRCDDLFLPGPDLRLNSARIDSDVARLEQALRKQSYEEAVALYGGDFLDDFHVSRAGDFERWVCSFRQQLAGRMAAAFDALAARASRADDVPAVIQWRRRQLDLDPLNGRAALELAAGMARAGDRVGALRVADAYSSLVRSELGVEPDVALRELTATLRRSPTSEASPASPAAPTTPAARDRGAPREGAPAVATAGRRVDRGRRPFTRVFAWAGVASIVLAASALAVTRWVRRAEATPSSGERRIVVAPFRVAAAEPSLRFLREGMVELLTIRLGDDAARSVDPGIVFREWRGDRIDAPGAPLQQIQRFARTVGAAAVVTGSIVGNTEHAVITASLIDAADMRTTSSATVEGPLGDLTTLVDQLAGKLLILGAGEGERFVDRTTPSLRALRQYLDGQAAYRAAAYAKAARHFESALAADSAFALAAMYLALAADRVSVAEQHDRALAIAWANRFDLNERDHAHLVAFAGPRYPQPSPESEQLAAWEAAVALSPDRPEVWLELGARFFHAGPLLAVPDHDRRAALALRRALALDPSESAASRMLALLASRAGDTAALRALSMENAGRPDAPELLASFTRWRVAQALSWDKSRARLRTDLPRMTDASLRAIAMSSQYDGVGIDDGERALRLWRRRVVRGAEELDALLAEHSLAMNRGHPIVALDLTEQLEEVQPGSRAHLRLRVLDAIYGGGDSAAAASAIGKLERSLEGELAATEFERAARLADACVVAQWRLHRGAAGVAGLIAFLRQSGLPPATVPVGANPYTCATLLEASLAVSSRATDADAALARLDSLMLSGPAVSDASAYVHIWAARLWENRGRIEDALGAVRRRPYMAGWPRYLAATLREEGRLALLAGDTTGALKAFRQFLALRHSPDETLIPETDAVREITGQLSTRTGDAP